MPGVNRKSKHPELFSCFVANCSSIDEVIPFLNGREHLFGALRQNTELRTSLALTQPQALLLEARAVRQSLQVAQHHSASQFSLSRATYLSRLAEMGSRVGLRIEVASQFDLATTFWSQGEALASVKILQHLRRRDDLKAQDILVEASEILADLVSSWASAILDLSNVKRAPKQPMQDSNLLTKLFRSISHLPTGNWTAT